jgi:hypothetical protein
MKQEGNMAAEEKKYVELEVYGQSEQLKIVGRLLGLLTAKEYAGVIKKPELRSKLFTVASTKIGEIGELVDVEGMRLALVVKKKDEEVVFKKTLFFTEQLDLISHVVSDQDITFVGKDGSYILLTEAPDEQDEDNS